MRMQITQLYWCVRQFWQRTRKADPVRFDQRSDARTLAGTKSVIALRMQGWKVDWRNGVIDIIDWSYLANSMLPRAGLKSLLSSC